MKHGAITVCASCGGAPVSDHETAMAMGLTDHYMDVNKLEKIGKTLASGTMVELPDQFMQQMLAEVKRTAHLLPRRPRTKEVIEPLKKSSDQNSAGLCFKCWGVKPVFSERCSECNAEPKDEKSMITSVAVSGVFFSEAGLRQLSHRIRSGAGDVDLWPVRAEGLKAFARKFLELKASPEWPTSSKHRPTPSHGGVPWKPVPFSPTLPDLEHATPVAGSEGVSFKHAVFQNVRPLIARVQPSDLLYLFVFVLYSKSIGAPVYFVTLEQSASGNAFLCAFDSLGNHINFGDGIAFNDLEAFKQQAMELSSRALEKLTR